jgi:hypothetical protein
MYLIFATVIVLIIVLFGSSIYKLIVSNVTNSAPSIKIGNLWFVTLLVVNITIIIFIFTFYYSKANAVGKVGPAGDKGKSGSDGEPCMITIPNSMYYAPYTKISP